MAVSFDSAYWKPDSQLLDLVRGTYRPTERHTPKAGIHIGCRLVALAVLVGLAGALLGLLKSWLPSRASGVQATVSHSRSRLSMRSKGQEVDTVINGLITRVCDMSSPVAFVVTHPYGPLGGDLRNNVVSAGDREAPLWPRGVGGSAGRATWTGSGERDDVKAVCAYLLGLPNPAKHLILIGYSYGSVITSSVAGEIPEVVAYVAISYPFSVAWALTLFQSRKYTSLALLEKPKLLIMGTSDNFTGIATYEAKVRDFPSPKTVVIVKDADHFWLRREGVLCDVIQQWLEDLFGTRDLRDVAARSGQNVPLQRVDDKRLEQ